MISQEAVRQVLVFPDQAQKQVLCLDVVLPNWLAS